MKNRGTTKRWRRTTEGLLAACIVGLAGCSEEKEPSHVRIGTPNPRIESAVRGKLRTPYTTEIEYIVHHTLLDLAEMAWLGAKGASPPPGGISIRVLEQEDASWGNPTCDVTIRIGGRTNTLTLSVAPAWDARLFLDAGRLIFSMLGLQPAQREVAAPPDEPEWMARVLDTRSALLEQWNQELSSRLGKDMLNPGLHQSAAFVIGVLVQRENAGAFSEVRTSLCRLTAHLTFATLLGNAQRTGAGDLAEIISLAAVSRQTDALGRLNGFNPPTPPYERWARILRCDVTGDFRLLENHRSGSAAERLAWVRAMATHLGAVVTWSRLGPTSDTTQAQLLRVLRNSMSSVELRHSVLDHAANAEVEEFDLVWRSAKHALPEAGSRVSALNTEPSRFVHPGGGVHVLSPGDWAMHFQRHLCDALEDNIEFVQYSLGMKEEAQELTLSTAARYGGLMLFPLTLGTDSSGRSTIEPVGGPAMDDLILNHPELIPGGRWRDLVSGTRRVSSSHARLFPSLERWHRRYPLPGTAYASANARMASGRLQSAPFRARAEDYYRIAPHHPGVCNAVIESRYGTNRSTAGVSEVWGIMTNYSLTAKKQVAETLIANLPAYEAALLGIAELDPMQYSVLGEHIHSLGQTNRGMELIDKAFTLSHDRVGASRLAPRRESMTTVVGRRLGARMGNYTSRNPAP